MTLKVQVNDLHFQYQPRVSQDTCLEQIWWFQIKPVTSYRADKVKFTDGRTDRQTDGQTQATTIPLRPERTRGKTRYTMLYSAQPLLAISLVSTWEQFNKLYLFVNVYKMAGILFRPQCVWTYRIIRPRYSSYLPVSYKCLQPHDCCWTKLYWYYTIFLRNLHTIYRWASARKMKPIFGDFTGEAKHSLQKLS